MQADRSANDRAGGAGDDDNDEDDDFSPPQYGADRRRFRARPRKVTDASVVYSIRLGPDEVRELQFRAEVVGLPPAVLARQFVRRGLLEEDDVGGDDEVLTALAYRLARDAAALRRLLRVEPPTASPTPTLS